MRSLLFIIAAVLSLPMAPAAQNTITFKGQVVNSTYGHFPKMKLLVNKRPVVTDDSGYFQVVLPKTNSHLLLNPVSPEYLVLYPAGGYVTIPRELNDVTQVVVGTAAELASFKRYLSLYAIISQLKPPINDSLQAMLDSLKMALHKHHITASEIDKAEKAATEKAGYLSSLIGDALLYRRRVYELNEDFKRLAGKSMEDGNALNKLLDAVSQYNSIYSKFDRQHAIYENMKFQNWNNGYLLPTVHTYSDFLIFTVQADGIYPMQELLLQIKQYYSGKKKNKALRHSLEDQINSRSLKVEKILSELDGKTKTLFLGVMRDE